MEYKHNGKTIRIPDKEIAQSMKILGLTKEEAIQMWLEDNGHEENAEQTALDEKAKANRVTATVHKAKGEGKEKKPRERKPNEEKRAIVESIAEVMQEWENLKSFSTDFGNVKIINPERQIDFHVGGNHYSVTLTLHRPPKNK